MSEKTNGLWKAVALTALAALQGLCFWTLSEIRDDIKNLRSDEQTLGKAVAAQQAQLAIIVSRHLLEDSKSTKPTP